MCYSMVGITGTMIAIKGSSGWHEGLRAVFVTAAGSALCITSLAQADVLHTIGFAHGDKTSKVTAPSASNVPTVLARGIGNASLIIFFRFALTPYFSFGIKYTQLHGVAPTQVRICDGDCRRVICRAGRQKTRATNHQPVWLKVRTPADVAICQSIITDRVQFACPLQFDPDLSDAAGPDHPFWRRRRAAVATVA
jgi:hypothetical protein